MPIERTLSIVKPDGVSRNLIGEVYRRFEQAGLRVVAARMTHLSQAEAEGFYAVHRERPFFKDLVRFMTSGPVMVQVLEGEGAIAKNRDVMGATDPKKAAKGTIRAGQFSQLATVIQSGAEHGMWSFDRYQRWMAQKKDWERPSLAAAIPEERESTVVPAALAPVPKAKPPPKDASFEISIDEEEIDLAELAKKIDAKTR